MERRSEFDYNFLEFLKLELNNKFLVKLTSCKCSVLVSSSNRRVLFCSCKCANFFVSSSFDGDVTSSVLLVRGLGFGGIVGFALSL
jgi:hypothetical protein